MRIYVSGSLAYDRIMTFPGKFADHILPDKIHILNVCFLVDGLTEKFGGTAGNIAYTMSLLGEKPLILATSGKDFAAYRDWLGSLKLPLDGIRHVADEFTAGAYITTDLSDNQITGFNPGAMKQPCGYAFPGLDPAKDLAIVSPGNLGDMREFPRFYKERGVRFLFDPGQNITAFPGEVLTEMITGANFFISNDYELEMVMNATGLSKAELLERTPVIITTLGENGSLIAERGGETKIGAARVASPKDPTGAGDAFRAGLLKGLAEGKPLAEAARVGSVAAAYAVECHGTQEHAFTMSEFAGRYKKNFGE